MNNNTFLFIESGSGYEIHCESDILSHGDYNWTLPITLDKIVKNSMVYKNLGVDIKCNNIYVHTNILHLTNNATIINNPKFPILITDIIAYSVEDFNEHFRKIRKEKLEKLNDSKNTN